MDLSDAQLDRAAGVLLAVAAGDALGAGYEFTFPAPQTPIAMIGGGIGAFEVGEWTDDTAMTVAVAQAAATGDLTTAAGLDAVAAGFLRWFDDDPKDVGVQTSTVLGRRDPTAAAMQRTAASLPGLTGGNGSLMRTAPVALAFLNDARSRASAAEQVSRLTHADPRAGQACQIWCHLIATTVVTGEIDRDWNFLTDLGSEAGADWARLKVEAEAGTPSDFPRNGWVVHALQTAWSAICHVTTTGEQAVRDGLELAVRAGQDTDTTAAIAGAVLGARWGAGAVPAEWRSILHGWPGLSGDDLVELAEAVVHRGS